MDIQLVFLNVKKCEVWIRSTLFLKSQDEWWRVTPRGPMWTIPSMINYLLSQEIWSSEKARNALWVTNKATSLLKPSTCHSIISHWPTKQLMYIDSITCSYSFGMVINSFLPLLPLWVHYLTILLMLLIAWPSVHPTVYRWWIITCTTYTDSGLKRSDYWNMYM